MALFRAAVGVVRSVNNDRVEDRKRSPAPQVQRAEQDDRSVMDSLLEDLSESDLLETGEHLSYTQPGVQRSVLRKLKSGKYSIQSEIDLHGLTVDQARLELSDFLKAAQQRRHLCIRVIHAIPSNTITIVLVRRRCLQSAQTTSRDIEHNATRRSGITDCVGHCRRCSDGPHRLICGIVL